MVRLSPRDSSYYLEKRLPGREKVEQTFDYFWKINTIVLLLTLSEFVSDNSPIERTHLQFCKRYFEVHNKASNIACRAELGKFPLIIDINKKVLSYLNYLHQKDENSIVRQARLIFMITEKIVFTLG